MAVQRKFNAEAAALPIGGEKMIRTKIHPDTGYDYRILSVQGPDGLYTAMIDEGRGFHATGLSREQAEEAASMEYLVATCDFSDEPWTKEETAEYEAAHERSQAEISAGKFTTIYPN